MLHTHEIFRNYDLSQHNTMALSCIADTAIVLHDQSILPTLPQASHFVLSGGSNVLLPSHLQTTVLMPKFRGIRVISQNDKALILHVNAGENWHDLVTHCVHQGWYGLENLALIPGLVGASPVQNIGAYGVQLQDVLVEVEAFDFHQKQFVNLSVEACQFRYRHSIFKDYPHRYLICSVKLRLHKDNQRTITNYGDLRIHAKAYAEREHRTQITPLDVYHAVIDIRSAKLPDPKNLANCGSFFQNPVISQEQFIALKQQFTDLPSYPIDDNLVKIPAGWLIEQAGLKGGGIPPILTHTKQALVLTNHAPYQATQAQINLAQQHICQKVYQKFAVHLTPEPVWVNTDGSYR